MNFQTLARDRYSCRSMMSGHPVEEEKIELILKSAQAAPSACNLQRHRITVVKSESALELLRSFTSCHFDAPVIFVISLEESTDGKIADKAAAEKFGLIDMGIIVSHMALQAQDEGLASTIVGDFDSLGVKKAFSLPDSQTPVLLLPVGYASEKGGPCILHKSRKPLADTVTFA